MAPAKIQIALAKKELTPPLVPLDLSPNSLWELLITPPEPYKKAYRLAAIEERLELLFTLEINGEKILYLTAKNIINSAKEPLLIAASDLHEGSGEALITGLHLHLRLFNVTF